MKYWPVIVALVAVAVWMVAAGRVTTGEEGRYSIVTDEQYVATLAEVRDKTQQPILDFDAGFKLSTTQVQNLKDSIEKIQQLIAFDPTNFGPYVMMAKTQRALGNSSEAVRHYEQALILLPSEYSDQETLWTAAEVNYDLGTHFYEASDYKRAEPYALQAVQLINDHPKYLVGLAAIQAQLGKLKDARALVDAALAIDPENAFTKSLDDELKRAGA
jgi:tetratricopeptide (TPR) repeat protein